MTRLNKYVDMHGIPLCIYFRWRAVQGHRVRAYTRSPKIIVFARRNIFAIDSFNLDRSIKGYSTLVYELEVVDVINP